MPWRRWVLIGGGIMALLDRPRAARRCVNLITDVMWFDALGRTRCVPHDSGAQVALFGIGFAAMLVPALISIWLARRIAPQAPVRQLGGFEMPDASRFIGVGLTVVAVLLALGSARRMEPATGRRSSCSSTAAEWGTTDPTLGRDIGFYVFDLPFWRFLLGWASTTLIVVGLLTLGTYAARRAALAVPPLAPVRAHLSVIGALLLAVVAAGYQLDIAELAYAVGGPNDSVHAALYTDMNARLPAFVILTGVALVSAALLLLNTWFRTLWLLALAGGAWLVLSFLVGGLYPTFVQTVQVNPNELNVERPYLRQPHRVDARGLRPRRDRAARLHRRAGADARGVRRGCGHHRQPAAVGLPAAADDVRAGPDPAPLLRLPRRRHRPLSDRRRAAPDHAQRPRARRREARPRTRGPGRTSGSSTRTATASPPSPSTR